MELLGPPPHYPVFCGHHGRNTQGRIYPRPPVRPVDGDKLRRLAEVTRGLECWACAECAEYIGLNREAWP